MKIQFDDTKTAFSIRTDAELRRAYQLFKLIDSPSVVKFGKGVLKAALAMRLPVNGIIRNTVFRHFCAGETISDCDPVIDKYSRVNIKGILDYSVEGKESEVDFNHTTEVILQIIESAAGNPHLPFSVFKPSGLGRFELYQKVSEGRTLSDAEKQEWGRTVQRYESIAEAAHHHGIPVMVDAEESWIQKAIDDIVTELMKKHNRDGVVILNTVQLYRHDRLAFLKNQMQHAIEHQYFLGVKLVRGAYMEKERNRAEELGLKDPIQPDKEATDRDYDSAMEFLFDHLDRVKIVAGSHNEWSCQKIVDMMAAKKLSADDGRIWFAQLLGMSDHITFNLAANGYNVVKYMPFGPIREVVPYLIRRAEENTSVKGQTGRELSLIKKELFRRRAPK